jgi:oxygen-independent coproporphyrinogen-3 oxidase
VPEWTYIPELLANPVPRYTSYPTAAEFGSEVGGREFVSALEAVRDDEPVSLYVHIPYCHEICWYCGCNTGAANKARRLGDYVETLRTEIEMVAALLAGRGRVGRIAFGGGSPNALSPEQFGGLLALLRSKFGADDALLSIELDPRSLTDPWVDAIRSGGVERASLGVQTLDGKVQGAIGRLQPLDLIQRSVEKLRGAGVSSLNFDLMYGLPFQGLSELEVTLDATIAMRPDRIALFGYAHVPQLIARQRRIDDSALPDAQLRFAQAALGHHVLTHAGYDPVGFDHYALPRDPMSVAARRGLVGRNFQGFTDDVSQVMIGLGASAISQFPGLIVQNEKNAGRYKIKVSSGRPAAALGIRRSVDDQHRARVIEQLLCNGEADCRGLVDADLKERLRPFLDHGLVTIEGARLRMPDYARPYARVIASKLDRYRQPAARRFSSAI